MKIKVAINQFKIGANKVENIKKAKEFIMKSILSESNIIVLPECFVCPYDVNVFNDYSEIISDDSKIIQLFKNITSEYTNIYIFAGSIIEKEEELLYNTCLVFNKGEIISKYRKNNLYKIKMKEHSFSEGDVLSPGTKPTIVDTSFGKIGIGICYDVRFPELAKFYQENGCKIIIYPGSFNRITGPVHWKLLQQARALDNLLYVVSCSAACCPGSSFESYGKSYVISPWGEVLSETELDKEQIRVVDIDLELINEIRSKLPILN
jgi:omega-amidase